MSIKLKIYIRSIVSKNSACILVCNMLIYNCVITTNELLWYTALMTYNALLLTTFRPPWPYHSYREVRASRKHSEMFHICHVICWNLLRKIPKDVKRSFLTVLTIINWGLIHCHDYHVSTNYTPRNIAW